MHTHTHTQSHTSRYIRIYNNAQAGTHNKCTHTSKHTHTMHTHTQCTHTHVYTYTHLTSSAIEAALDTTGSVTGEAVRGISDYKQITQNINRVTISYITHTTVNGILRTCSKIHTQTHTHVQSSTNK